MLCCEQRDEPLQRLQMHSQMHSESVLSTFPVFKKIKSNVALMQNLQIIVVHIEGHWIIMEIFLFCFVYFIL